VLGIVVFLRVYSTCVRRCLATGAGGLNSLDANGRLEDAARSFVPPDARAVMVNLMTLVNLARRAPEPSDGFRKESCVRTGGRAALKRVSLVVTSL
jgi:hypothetical protein